MCLDKRNKSTYPAALWARERAAQVATAAPVCRVVVTVQALARCLLSHQQPRISEDHVKKLEATGNYRCCFSFQPPLVILAVEIYWENMTI